MAAKNYSHRAVAAGISGGLAVALPATAALVAVSLEGTAASLVRTALSFAGGALVGIGLFAVSDRMLSQRGARDEDSSVEQREAFHARAEQGVPVISRAVDAMDEEAAWADIDAMFAEDSPISCDPISSKDMYQIAFEELRRSEQLAQERSREEKVAQDAQMAAMASLYGSPASVVVPPAAPQPVAPAESQEQVVSAPAEVEVPVADYSGHEEMWAAAVAILEEDQDSAKTACLSASDLSAGAVQGKASRSSSHDYLRVIQGGTAQFTALQVEA